MQKDAPDRAPEWLSTGEKGTFFGLRFLVWVATRLGRAVGRFMLRFVALYYVTFHSKVRKHSRAWLERAHGRPAKFRDCYRHVFCFAQVALDRVFLLQKRSNDFEFSYTGRDVLLDHHKAGKGAILLTAHVGSQAAMSGHGEANALRINVAGYFRNARMINAIFERLDPETTARVIHLEPGAMGPILSIQERIEAGEFVVLAGDRIGLNDRTLDVDFMGSTAAFPQGPFILASVLRCPVLLVFALYHEPNRYALYCERLSPGIDVPRAQRQAAIEDHVRLYAERLEHYARLAPDNWFNFYDFWSPR